jgi:hypothetical protein
MHLSHTLFYYYPYLLAWKPLKTWECKKSIDIFGKVAFIVKIRGATSYATNPFCIANSNLWKTTFMYLGDTILLCMTFWTIFKRFTAFGAKKLKVSNANAIKKRVEAALRCPSNNKISNPQSYKGETLVKSTQACFSPIQPYTNIYWTKCRSSFLWIAIKFHILL